MVNILNLTSNIYAFFYFLVTAFLQHELLYQHLITNMYIDLVEKLRRRNWLTRKNYSWNCIVVLNKGRIQKFLIQTLIQDGENISAEIWIDTHFLIASTAKKLID